MVCTRVIICLAVIYDGLDAELATAHVEEILERWTKQVDDENVVKTLLTKVVDLRNTG